MNLAHTLVSRGIRPRSIAHRDIGGPLGYAPPIPPPSIASGPPPGSVMQANPIMGNPGLGTGFRAPPPGMLGGGGYAQPGPILQNPGLSTGQFPGLTGSGGMATGNPIMGQPSPIMRTPMPLNFQNLTQYLPSFGDRMRIGGGLHPAMLARGGDVKGFDLKEHLGDSAAPTGFLEGGTPGRADKVISKAASGSYIIPADIIAGLGEGNSLSGAKVMDRMLSDLEAEHVQKRAKGGATGAVPVALSHGEYSVSPRHVQMIGGGDLNHGHAVLDKWVQMERKRQIDTLKKLKPPVGAKAA